MSQQMSSLIAVMPLLEKGIQVLPNKKLLEEAYVDIPTTTVAAIAKKFNINLGRVTPFIKLKVHAGMSHQEIRKCDFLARIANEQIPIKDIVLIQWISNTIGG